MSALDPLKITLHGHHLIEASAGTGKTYTITGLYLRLLIERELHPENILVVTYTEAACQELRDSIRQRLMAALDAVDGGSADKFLTDLFAGYMRQGRDVIQLRRTINLALMDFDLAAVYTIHGFCMRVLLDCAFESGFLFKTEFVENDEEILQQVIDDYWRLQSGTWHLLLTAHVFALKWSPDMLLKMVTELLAAVRSAGDDVMQFSGWIHPDDFSPDLCGIKKCWLGERSVIVDLLFNSSALGRAVSTYKKNNVETWVAAFDDYFASDMSAKTPPPLEALRAFSRTALEKGTKPKQVGKTPTHRLFELCDQLIVDLQQAGHGLLRDLVLHSFTTMKKRKQEVGLLAFDDLLTGVRDALADPKLGGQLQQRVALQYPVALIDEFQDTDPVQFEIFNRVYLQQKNMASLFMVGDPKQAIYGFRGADIFAYLEASTAKGANLHTLEVNWRSEPGLIQACNHLFDWQGAFVLPGLDFSNAGWPQNYNSALTVQRPNDAPLTLLHFSDTDNRKDALALVAQKVARMVRDLLHEADRGEIVFAAEGDDCQPEKLKAGDIAILVRKHSDGLLVRQALADLAINSVIRSRQTVWESPEAKELYAVLQAVAAPGDVVKMKAALVTAALGGDVAELVGMADEKSWEDRVFRFMEYRQQWLGRGLAPMLYHLMEREGVSVRLCALKNGERSLTNLRHLVELLQETALHDSLAPEALLAWFERQRNCPGQQDATLVRLESDEDLVKIVTVHASKGLQYPVVFCPFFWDSSFLKKGVPPFAKCHENKKLLVDFATDNFAERLQRQNVESLAEEVRLLYVALTRAQHRLFLFWGRVRSGTQWATATSALHYLLNCTSLPLASDDFLKDMKDDFAEISYEDHLAQLTTIAERSAGSIQLSAVETTQVDNQPYISLQKYNLTPAKSYSRELNPYQGIRSFSALHHLANVAVATSSLREGADYDALNIVKRSFVTTPQLPDSGADDIFAFPRGAKAGSCLHDIFEHFDFQQKDEVQTKTLVDEKLLLYGIDLGWSDTIVKLLADVVATPLNNQGLCLSGVSRASRLDEMEFYYKIPSTSDQSIKQIFSSIMHNTPAGTVISKANNFMKGFVDLIFSWQGRFYIVDYKSNHLGNRVEDYGAENLQEAMSAAEYDLQYYIYTVALHRYLQNRLPDYDFDRHFGGVFYLFIRGMRPDFAHRFGVYADRPDRDKVFALDHLCLEGVNCEG